MLPAQHLITSIHSHWASQVPNGTPTIYPGARVDTNRLTDWYELWVDAWSDSPRRHADPDGLTVSILIHCFSRQPTRKTTVQRLASVARTALARQTLSIIDADAPTPRTIGFLRLREHAVHDLSRNHAALGQERLQHLVLVFEARAEEVE